MNRKLLILIVSGALILAMAGCSSPTSNSTATKSAGTEQAVADAVDVYVYGYPLVTMDMTRRQMTNVATPDAAHAPMGQI